MTITHPSRLLLVPAIVAATAVAADPAADVAEANAAIDAAFDAGDAAGVAAIFAEDAVVLAPGWEPVQGRSRIEEQYAAFLRAGFHDIEHITDSVELIGDDALVEISHYEVKRTDGSGTAFEERGKSLTIWRRETDGAWRISIDMFNDLPRE